MSIKRVALIFDNQVRPETTGTYCLHALQGLVEVVHFLPDQADRIPRTGFDLYLTIDDGLRQRQPAELHPCAWWVIDTHIDASWAEEKGRDFDWLFAAQRDGAEGLERAGLPTHWLPLACDPSIHRPHPLGKRWDVSFVGKISPGPRHDLLVLLQQHFPNGFIGQAFFDEYARVTSQSRIGFNCSVANDVNMRVFETVGCGTLLVTNDLRDNGQEELLIADKHLVTYRGPEELLDKLRFYLSHADVRERLAQAGYAEAVGRHTYRHRMQSLLESIEAAPAFSRTLQPSATVAADAISILSLFPALPGNGSDRGSVSCGNCGCNSNGSVSNAIERSTISLQTPAAEPPAEHFQGEIGNEQRNPARQVGSPRLDSIDIIVKTFLRPQALLRLLRSIREFYPHAHVTIADDGNLRESPDADGRACCALIAANDNFVLHSLPFASGVTAGRNLLIDKTNRPFLLLLDDDFCFTAETRIERLWERLNSEPELGIVAGACIDVLGDERRPRNSGGTLTIEGGTLYLNTDGWHDRTVGLRDFVPQFALIRRDVFRDVRWEGGIGAEHYDFCLQLKQSGWKVAHDLSVLVDHYPLTPTLTGYAEHRLNYAEPQQWLLRKWNLRRIVQDGQTIVEASRADQAPGADAPAVEIATASDARPATGGATVGVPSLPQARHILNGEVAHDACHPGTTAPSSILHPPSSTVRPLPVKDAGYFDFPRPEVVALIPATARRVLDIGCGAGRLGALLKQRQPANVVGIELQPHVAALARQRLDEVLEQNIEDPDLDFPPGRFDCIVCADVLEHLREPAAALDRIRRWLTPQGVLVASLPNVRHHSVVAALLAGNWTYESAGLLDGDHVRFFTRREIEKLLYRQGFEIQTLNAKPGPGYEEWDKAGRQGDVRIGSLSMTGLPPEEAEEFFTYQYLVVARPAVGCVKPLSGEDAPAVDVSRVRGTQTAAESMIEKLARDNPWPAEKPGVPLPTANLGWFKEPQRELVQRELSVETKLVVELGAWLGLSTRFMADQAQHARIVTIDHWRGSPEHHNDPGCAAMLPTLFETFLSLSWEYRDRIIPLKMTVGEGLRTIARYGLKPDIIFVDAEHTYEAVSADLELSHQLFPQARLIGDDYDSPDVRRALDEFAAAHGFEVEPVGTGWRSWRLVSQAASETNSIPKSEIPIPIPKSSLTSIIVVAHNQLGYTKECVDSICLRTDEPYELIFVDNGSTDGTVGYLRSVAESFPPAAGKVSASCGLQTVRLIKNADNLGFPAAVNQGLQVARGDVVLLLNNDTVVTTGWLRRMLEVLDSNPQIGLAGPCSNRVSGAQMVPAGYQDMALLDGFAWDWGKRHHGIVEETDRLIGFCLAIKRAVIDQIGLFDERFGIGCFEDDDFCLRALRAGWKAVIARSAFVHHYGNRTFQGSGVDLGSVLEANRQKFLDKWSNNSGMGISDFGFSPTTGAVEACVTPPSGADAPAVDVACAPNPRMEKGSAVLGISSDRSTHSVPEPKSEIRNPNSKILAGSRFRLAAAPSGGLLLQLNPATEGKPEIPNPKSQFTAKPHLSLCMIVRDNETTIGPALESIRPWVDEIIVVDTGSQDKTPDICRQYGASMFEFPWCDDFSAARNESLRHARGEWIFWMDSDDTISAECGRQLRGLADGPHPENRLGYIVQVHCPGPGEEGQLDVTAVDHAKLIRNRPDLRFEGRIHEQMLPAIRRAGGDVAWTDIYVRHSGSDHSPAGWQRKLDRDLRILHAELADTPNHPFVLFNLGMTYADAKRYDEAVGYLGRCVAVSTPDQSHLRKAFALMINALSQSGRHDAAWTACQQGLALYPDDKELLFRSAMLHHHFGRLPDAEKTYRRVLNDREERYFSSIDQGLAGFKTRHNLAVVYEDMGRLDQAEGEWRHIVDEVPEYHLGWRGLGEILLRQGKVADAERLLERLASTNGSALLANERRILLAKLAAARGDIPTAVRELQAARAAHREDVEPLRLLSRILFEQGQPEAAEAVLRELTELAPDDAAALHNLGTIRQRLKQPENAAAAFRAALRLRPNSARTHLQLGYALKDSGAREDAARAWRTVLQFDPGNTEARTALSAL